MTDTHRLLTKKEILELAHQIVDQDRVDLHAIRKGIARLFPGAYKAILYWECAYNDETHDLRPTEIEVWDANGKPLKRDISEDDWDDELSDWMRDVEIGDVSENDSMEPMTIWMDETKGPSMPALYVRAETA